MVDVSTKGVTVRAARATGKVRMRANTAKLIQAGKARKGDVLGIARIAAISATKLTPQLIPLCHAIPIEAVTVEFSWSSREGELAVLSCEVEVRTTAKTGVEMEALTGVSIGCLTVYDMVKSVDREIAIGPVELLEKSGGKSGPFRRSLPDGG